MNAATAKQNIPNDLLPEVPRLPVIHPDQQKISNNSLNKPNPPSVWASLARSGYHIIREISFALWSTFRSIAIHFWNHPAQAVFDLALLIILGVMIITGSQIHDHMILGKISNQTVDNIVAASKYSREYGLLGVGRRGAEEFLRVGAPIWVQREGARAVLFHARKAGLSLEHQAVLLAIVEIESGFNPTAKAPTTTACGLFQFIRTTGEKFGLQQANCMDPWANAQAGVQHYILQYESKVASQVSNLDDIERLFRIFELSYYIHHDGPNGSNPSIDLKATVLSGTQFLFSAYHTLQEEAASRQQAPTFAERFAENLWSLLGTMKNTLSRATPTNTAALAQTLDNAKATAIVAVPVNS